MKPDQRAIQAKKITFIGAIANTVQGFMKILGGFWFNSDSLIADGFHSLSDLITDFMVIFGAHYGNQDADASHPYGHQRIETATTLFLSMLLVAVGVGIGWHAYEEWSRHTLTQPNYGALLLALLSVLINEVLFYYTHKVGVKVHSEMIKANAWHHRSDSASSLVVTLGIIGSMLGYKYFDALAAIIVALLIIKMGITYTWNSVKELVDTAVDPGLLNKIEQTITSVPGVNKIHQLRTRSMGARVLVDVHILVFPHLTVSEGHYIAQCVHYALLKAMPLIIDVTVHVDPEDDESVQPSKHLPPRKDIERHLLHPLQKAYPSVRTWNLHYLEGKISIDLYCTSTEKELQSIYEACQKSFHSHEEIKIIRFYTLTHEVVLNDTHGLRK